MMFPMLPEALAILLFSQVSFVSGQGNTTQQANVTFTSDPYLQYQPHFAHSLPIQLLIAGVVLTLTTTLLIQLLFTWQYHWPLARINWILQFTGVCTLLLNVIAILCVVLSALSDKSKQWPYMFEYIAIDVPRHGAWSVPEIAAWYVMEAGTSALASITHIQFLTFLYPSRLEARLVFLLLGPLAIVSSIMTLLPIVTSPNSDISADNMAYNETISNITASVLNSTSILNSTFLEAAPSPGIGNSTSSSTSEGTTFSNQQRMYDLIDTARNICNLTLSFLFTLSLLIWGFLVNRRSAWRTDGGTAAFGAGALFLALISTGLNFLNVFTVPRYEWLSSLLWAVVLWQSFLGWWWWVGSASGIATRELDMEKRGKKEQKRAKRNRQKFGYKEERSVPPGDTTARLDRWRSSVNTTLARRRPSGNDINLPPRSQPLALPAESIELSTISSIPSAVGDPLPHDSTASISTSRASIYTTHVFAAVHRAWRALRQAHVRAVRVQAIEQRQIQLQMQLENGHGLGRFPGGPGGERDISVLRGADDTNISDGEVTPPESGHDVEISRATAAQAASSSTWWWKPIEKWRLRDSTTY